MLQFDYPWLFVLTPLPLLVWWLAPPYRERTQALRMPFLEQMAQAIGTKPAHGAIVARSNLVQKVLAPLCWLLLMIALASPQWVSDPIEKSLPARDLMLAIDLSQSMETQDFVDKASGNKSDRLSAVKSVVHGFIDRRRDDRLGLIVFGNGAFPLSPLTLDHASVQTLLDETRSGMAGPQTAIGDAIGVAVKLITAKKDTDSRAAQNEHILVLLTDGNDTASHLPPEEAAKIAHQRNIIIHTIGIGDPTATGENRVNLDGLKKISEVTGGQSFRGEDLQQLESIYSTIDKLTPRKVTIASYRPKRALYWMPLGAAAALLVSYHMVMLLLSTLHARTTATRLNTATARR